MTRTSIPALVATFSFVAAAVAIITWRFYAHFPPIPSIGAFTVWGLAVVCAGLIIVVRNSLGDDHGIGLDPSQLDPITVARIMVVGKASAWTGAVIGGVYTGIAVYTVPQMKILIAAEAEAPTVLAAAIGAIALAIAGVVLERNCETPPPPDGEIVG